VVTALSGSGFTVIRNIAKHIAIMTNVTTVKMSFMKTPIAFCFAVTSVSQLPSRDLPTLALLTHTGGHRELSIANCAELLRNRRRSAYAG
jgi:hypothetical protein